MKGLGLLLSEMAVRVFRADLIGMRLSHVSRLFPQSTALYHLKDDRLRTKVELFSRGSSDYAVTV